MYVVHCIYVLYMGNWEGGAQGGSGEVIELNDILKLLLIPGASAAGLADVTVSESRVAALGEITVGEVAIISRSCLHLSSPAAHPDTKIPGLG